jgi:uncharacterized SAM-binding protein YcdF (DUF218 family)
MLPMIADWLTSLGLGAAKPVLAALVLPPAPLLALAFAGALLTRARPRTGRWLAGLACAGLWLASCTGAAEWVEGHTLAEPPALDATQVVALRARAAAGQPTAIVVLGGGLSGPAPEYATPDLEGASLQRLRYAVWLSRRTGVPVAATGGLGWAASGSQPLAEAGRMAEVARSEWNLPLRWTEAASRDTHENAVDTVALLRPDGIRELVLVTQGWHMPRALREFRAATAAAGGASAVRITPAPIGQARGGGSPLLDWLPSGEGTLRMRQVLHEVLAGLGDRR